MGLALPGANDAAALFRQGVELRGRGDLPGALERFRRAASINPAIPNIYREIGLILIELRDFSAAADALRRAVRENASDFDSRYNLALSLANGGRLEEAVREARKLANDKPRWATAFYGLGHIYAMRGDREAAAQALRTAATLDSSLFRAWFELGKVLAEAGDREGAIEAFRNATRADPRSSAARYRLGVLLREAGEQSAASAELSRARELRDKRAKGEQAASAYREGAERLDHGDFAGAVEALRRAANLRPDFGELRTALADAEEQWGWKLEQSGDLSSALSHYQAAVALAPSARLHNHVGVLLAQTTQLDAAIESFRAALALEPGFANAEKNLRQALELQSAHSAQGRR